MRIREERLMEMIREREINYRDAALILLIKDRLKPFAAVSGVTKKMQYGQFEHLMKLFHDLSLSFRIKNGRVIIGSFPEKHIEMDEGLTFGFPLCCVLEFEHRCEHGYPRHNHHEIHSPYIFHIPCCPQCTETKILEEEYKKHLKTNYPRIASVIEKSHRERLVEA